MMALIKKLFGGKSPPKMKEVHQQPIQHAIQDEPEREWAEAKTRQFQASVERLRREADLIVRLHKE